MNTKGLTNTLRNVLDIVAHEMLFLIYVTNGTLVPENTNCGTNYL